VGGGRHRAAADGRWAVHLTPDETASVLTHSQADRLIVDDVGDAVPTTAIPPRPTILYTSGTAGTPIAVELPPTSWVGGPTIDEHLERLAQNSMVGHGRHPVMELPAEVRNRYDLSSMTLLLQVGPTSPEPDHRATIDWLASRGVAEVLCDPCSSEVATTRTANSR
jgi:long-chain acyl-CoA synthetase